MNRLNWEWPRRSVAYVFSIVLIVMLAGPIVAYAQQFLPVGRAFTVDVAPSGNGQLDVRLTVAPGTYLYRERLQAQLTPLKNGAPPAAPTSLVWQLPVGEIKHDPNFDKDVEVYHHDVAALLTLPAGVQSDHLLKLSYQGCADAGICYPPQHKQFVVKMGAAGLQEVVPATPADLGEVQPGAARQPDAPGSKTAGSQSAPPSEADGVSQALASGSLLAIVPAFLLAGVLLSLTPCVLPMVPILSSIIVGHGVKVGRVRGFALALAYSQGMALVYTAMGVAAGLLGQGLAAYLQHPWVVLSLAAVMVLLALSMFGLYELQLPAAVQSWLGSRTHHLPGGQFISVFVMGAVSALVVSPCVSAPLAGALLYIGQTHNVILGGSALYAMAWGMSVPLLLVGLSAGSLLPRTGPWMKAVKALFGVLILIMAGWISRPAWPYVTLLVQGPGAVVSQHQSVLPFKRVRTLAELDAAVQAAAQQGQTVMLDFYADWCTACLEMEHKTFRDAQVQRRLAKAVLLQADVTANSPDDRALLQRFQLFGPPGIVFFGPNGQEMTDRRVIGYQAPAEFLNSLTAAGL